MPASMSKASNHVQTGFFGSTNLQSNVTAAAAQLQQLEQEPQDVISSIMSFLPDNRPITSLQIVEYHEKCPKNFTAISRTYDQDADADLWRENNILFGRQTTRYLCLSKTEGLPEYVVETLKVISEKIQAPKQFSLLSRTADTEQKAWRKRQIAYKLSKRGTVTHAITDIILCSKLKIPPDGFKLAGDINGVLVCYKQGAIPIRQPPPPPVPIPTNTVPNAVSSKANIESMNGASEVEKALNRLNLNGDNNNVSPKQQPLPPIPNDNDHDYEEILSTYQIKSPQRPAPPLPAAPKTGSKACSAFTKQHSIGTLGAYTELEGVPFMINSMLIRTRDYELPTLPQLGGNSLEQLDYDFHLERQILCTMKSSSSKNPFFN